MSHDFPAPVYAETVLAPNFEYAQKHFLDALIAIHYAHTRMLARQRILTAEEERRLIAALDALDRPRIAAEKFSGKCEDLFYLIEARIEQAAGADVAGKMHTARSRNDIAITLFRMTARREVLLTVRSFGALRSVVLDLADRHTETVMPAHTHTQPAQPTTLAHYVVFG